MASDLSPEARELLAGLLEGKSLLELAPRRTKARREVEAYLTEALGSGSVAAAGGSAGRVVRREGDPPARPLPGRAVAFSDGASRGNPGPASYGIRIVAPDGTELLAEGRPIGRATNNVAEYRGVLAALERARELGIDELELRLDSELVVKQLRGEYRVKQPALADLKARVDRLLAQFRFVRISHVRREKNREADALANEALDAG